MAERVVVPQVADVGKISRDTFERVIYPRLGRARGEVLVGPRHGVDVGIVDLGGGQVMALTTDPFFIMPELGWERAAWFATHIVVSDAAASGLRPAYCAVDLNLPYSMTDDQLVAMWSAVDQACKDIGVAIVTGHTGRYAGCEFPMLGAATVISTGPNDSYVTPATSLVGDAVIMTKGAAIETAGMFGATFPDLIAAMAGTEVARAAEGLFYQMSTVEDSLTAVTVGVRERGVTAMHDATERGVWGGLCEMADASSVGMLIEQDSVFIRPEVQAICDLFQLDPYTASSEGTLLLTCRPHAVQAVLDRLGDAGTSAARIGVVTPAEDGVRVVRNGEVRALEPPDLDPFWPAYANTLEEQGRR